jgi:DNA-binding XRE family transcriptional regulator
MKHCIQCNGIDLRYAEETEDVRVPTAGGDLEVFVSGVSVTRCSTCGEAYLKGPDLERASLIASAEAIRQGVRDGPTLRFIRKALGLRTAELGELLGISAEAVSQWENGQRAAERSVWITVGDLVSDELAGVTTTFDRLRTFAEPRMPQAPVRVPLGLVGALVNYLPYV